MIYRIMTYNIQHGLDYSSRLMGKRVVNFKGICDVIRMFDPDILSINEIYGKGFKESEEYFDQVSLIARECNYPYYYFSKAIDAKNGEYGNAVFSKIPFIDKELIRIPDPVDKKENMKYESRVLTKFDFNDFDLISIHVGLNEDEQESAYHTLMNNISLNKKTVILGDFNMTVDNRIIQNIMKKFKESTISYKNEVINTYPSIDSRMKIDYIFLSKDISILRSEVIEAINTDHMPVYCVIAL